MLHGEIRQHNAKLIVQNELCKKVVNYKYRSSVLSASPWPCRRGQQRMGRNCSYGVKVYDNINNTFDF